jgi:DNA-binding transcriptional LysR family regulator
MNLDIDALRAFVAVADERSFTRAALSVSRTQSSVSVQIKNLESRLGFVLFERTQRSVALTQRGHTLLAYARNILQLNDDSVRALTAPQTHGRLRLGITEYFAPQHLPQLLARFQQHHPLLALEVSTGVTGTLRAMQKAGELDLVIGRSETGRRDATRKDRALLLRRERLRWVAARGFKLARHQPVPLALLPVGCGVRAQALAALHKQQRAWHAAYCGPSVLGLQTAVAAGLAVACLTHSACLEGFRALGAREGLPALADSDIVLYGPSGKAAAAQRQLAELADLVIEHFSQPVATASLSTS